LGRRSCGQHQASQKEPESTPPFVCRLEGGHPERTASGARSSAHESTECLHWKWLRLKLVTSACGSQEAALAAWLCLLQADDWPEDGPASGRQKDGLMLELVASGEPDCALGPVPTASVWAPNQEPLSPLRPPARLSVCLSGVQDRQSVCTCVEYWPSGQLGQRHQRSQWRPGWNKGPKALSVSWPICGSHTFATC